MRFTPVERATTAELQPEHDIIRAAADVDPYDLDLEAPDLDPYDSGIHVEPPFGGRAVATDGAAPITRSDLSRHEPQEAHVRRCGGPGRARTAAGDQP